MKWNFFPRAISAPERRWVKRPVCERDAEPIISYENPYGKLARGYAISPLIRKF